MVHLHLTLSLCLYLVAPWSKKLVLDLLAYLPPPWVVLAAVSVPWCLHSSEVFVLLACFSVLIKAWCLLPVFFRIAAHLQASGEKLGKKQKNRRRVEQLKAGKCKRADFKTWAASSCRYIWKLVLVQLPWHKLRFAGKSLARMLTGSLFILHSDRLFCICTHRHTHISILMPPCLLSFTGISQLNEFCMKKTVFPQRVCYGSNSHSVTSALWLIPPHSEQGHIVPYLYSQSDQRRKIIPSDS